MSQKRKMEGETMRHGNSRKLNFIKTKLTCLALIAAVIGGAFVWSVRTLRASTVRDAVVTAEQPPTEVTRTDAASSGWPIENVIQTNHSTVGAQKKPIRVNLPVAVIKIQPAGFEPSEITLPAGRLLLAIENRSGLEDLELQLSNETGQRIRELTFPRKKLSWHHVINPAAGAYLLSEASHPDWVCRITITR